MKAPAKQGWILMPGMLTALKKLEKAVRADERRKHGR